ncbi:MAG: Crp/Fnr family transcriptional regulator [Chitinispirillaceae bacterium]|nr:Crp/Fnr family transcriptional regulator [Chitinispirillaceae bacterium]
MRPFKKTIKSGMHLFREKDRSRELYIIQSGKMKVYRTAGGKEIELSVLEKGAVLGEMALIDGKPRSASAKALEDCTVIIIDAETFHNKIRGAPAWFMSIVRMASQKIRQANRRLQISSNEHQGAHVIMTLCLYFQRFDPGNNGLDIRSTQHHLIQLLGVTYDSVIRVLDFLHKNAFIDISENKVRAVDIDRIREYCEYLSLLIRSQYEAVEQFSNKAVTMASILVKNYPEIMKSNGAATAIDGDLFYHLLQTNDLHAEYLDFIEQLSAAGLCSLLHKRKEGNGRPLGDLTIKLQHTGWKRIYLFGKYNTLNPCG